MKQRWITAAIFAVVATVACGGERAPDAGDSDARPHAVSQPSTAPLAHGKIHTVDMITDVADGSNRFVPATLTVEEGDVIRFVLKSGVHNVNFLPDSNVGKSGLPPASQMLQLPGQTHDVPVTFGDGRYYFQCDPHALLGMVGYVTVK